MEQYILPRGLSQGFAAIADVADGASLKGMFVTIN